MRIHRAFTLLVSAALLSGCGDNPVQVITAPALESAVKFFNFGVTTPGVNFYANDTKMTAVLTSAGAEATTGTNYGVAATGGFYTGIKAGQYNLKAKLSASADTVAKLPLTVAAGKYYSFYTSGFYASATKTVDAFIVEDPLPQTVDPTLTYVRFVNAISNSTPMTLFAKNTTTSNEAAVGAEVAYKGAGNFVTMLPGAYDLNTRSAGSGANVISRAGVSFNAGRVYTITAYGDFTVTTTTGATRRQLDNTANR